MRPEELAARLSGSAFEKFQERLMSRVVLTALRNSQARTPVKTGALRRSETTRVSERGKKGFLGSNLVYARPVHDRNPFFQHGIADSRGDIEGLLQQAGEEYLKDVAG